MTDPDSIRTLLAAAKQVLADRELCVLMGFDVPISLDDLEKAVEQVEGKLSTKLADATRVTALPAPRS